MSTRAHVLSFPASSRPLALTSTHLLPPLILLPRTLSSTRHLLLHPRFHHFSIAIFTSVSSGLHLHAGAGGSAFVCRFLLVVNIFLPFDLPLTIAALTLFSAHDGLTIFFKTSFPAHGKFARDCLTTPLPRSGQLLPPRVHRCHALPGQHVGASWLGRRLVGGHLPLGRPGRPLPGQPLLHRERPGPAGLFDPYLTV